MCGMCGLWGTVADWSIPGVRSGRAAVAAQPVALRMAQAHFLSAIAAYGGVTVRDWMHASWIVENRSGASLIVEGMPQLWDAIGTLMPSGIDPLSPGFIAFMEAKHGGAA